MVSEYRDESEYRAPNYVTVFICFSTTKKQAAHNNMVVDEQKRVVHETSEADRKMYAQVSLLWFVSKFGDFILFYLFFSPKGYDFTLDGKYMLLAERRDCKDHASIFATDNWQLLKVCYGIMCPSQITTLKRPAAFVFSKHFEIDTDDLTAITWAPSGVTFCVLESPLDVKFPFFLSSL
jgi:hypothetical protein